MGKCLVTEREIKRSRNPKEQEKESKGKQSLGKTCEQGQREGNENECSTGKERVFQKITMTFLVRTR